jgi:hypothetical protein
MDHDLVPLDRPAQQPKVRTRIFSEYDILYGGTYEAHLAVDSDGRVVGATIAGTSDPREAELAAAEMARLRFDPEEPRYFSPQERQRFLDRPSRETWSEHHGPALLGDK